MTTKNATPKQSLPRRLSSTELRAAVFVCTLLLAGVAVIMRVDSPVVWTFLSLAIGAAALSKTQP